MLLPKTFEVSYLKDGSERNAFEMIQKAIAVTSLATQLGCTFHLSTVKNKIH